MRKLLFFKSSAPSSGKTEKSNRSPKGLISKFIILFCSCHRTPASERQSKGKQFEAEGMRNAHGLEVPGSAGSSRPVDGEQQQEMSRPIVTTTQYVPDCKDLTARAKEAMEENQLQEKYRAAEEDRDSFRRKYEEKDEDNKELHKTITRLLIRCSEQEKTIDGLREGLSEAIGMSDRHIGKLQSERMKLRAELAAAVRGNDILRAEDQNTQDDLSCATHKLKDLELQLYSKESEVEQLRAELAAAVRGNDILRAEVQNTQDDLSSATHKLKDLELQMLKKINCLRTNFEESTKQLAIMKGERVKQCSEENMLLSAEVNILKKKIEAIEEHLLN